MKIARMESVRWAFRVSSWCPTKEEWIKCIQGIQLEERERVEQFVYKKDAKSALVGRLLIRKMIIEKLGIPNDHLKLARNDRGKPYLVNEAPRDLAPSLSFNVSHHGDYTVLAAEPNRPVGVDVVKVEYSGGKPLPEYFRIMYKQFSDDEWHVIKSSAAEAEQLKNFYRFWSLKESYVKATGIGIGFNLRRLRFVLKSKHLSTNAITKDTQLHVDGNLNAQSNWTFHEILLDSQHCVSVALGPMVPNEQVTLRDEEVVFQKLTIDDLTRNLTAVHPPDMTSWERFQKKE